MDLKEMLRIIPDFPKPGINFIDITTLLKDGEAMKEAFTRMKEMLRGVEVDILVGQARLLVALSGLAVGRYCAGAQVRLARRSPETAMSWSLPRYPRYPKDAIRPEPRSWWWMTSYFRRAVWSTAELVRSWGDRGLRLIELSFLKGRESWEIILYTLIKFESE